MDIDSEMRRYIEYELSSKSKISPTKSEISRFFNIITKMKELTQSKRIMLFKDVCAEFGNLSEKKKNMRYLSKKLENKIRDVNHEMLKLEDRRSGVLNLPEQIKTVAEKFSFN